MPLKEGEEQTGEDVVEIIEEGFIEKLTEKGKKKFKELKEERGIKEGRGDLLGVTNKKKLKYNLLRIGVKKEEKYLIIARVEEKLSLSETWYIETDEEAYILKMGEEEVIFESFPKALNFLSLKISDITSLSEKQIQDYILYEFRLEERIKEFYPDRNKNTIRSNHRHLTKRIEQLIHQVEFINEVFKK
ncbi:MAG: hypothetical protein ACTSYA_05405 [Candidatus Kariarchaeaceae archaeon]